MAEILSQELINIIGDPDTLKTVTTVSDAGVPHTVYKGSLHVTEAGEIEFYELLESSENNRNLVYSIWNEKTVAVGILSKDKRSFEILGRPVRSLTAGHEYEKVYVALQEARGLETDLGAIWRLEPISVREESYPVRLKEQREKLPLLRHVDALRVGVEE